MKELIKEIKNTEKTLKSKVIEFINSIDEAPINKLGNNCFTVSFSEIQKHNIMSPFYFDVGAQKKELISLVNSSLNLSFVNAIKEIATTGKRTVRKGSSSYQQHYYPTVVSALKDLAAEIEN